LFTMVSRKQQAFVQPCRLPCRKEDTMERIKAVLPKKEDVVKNVVAGGVVITLMALMFTGGIGTVISLAAFGGIVITSNLMG